MLFDFYLFFFFIYIEILKLNSDWHKKINNLKEKKKVGNFSCLKLFDLNILCFGCCSLLTLTFRIS